MHQEDERCSPEINQGVKTKDSIINKGKNFELLCHICMAVSAGQFVTGEEEAQNARDITLDAANTTKHLSNEEVQRKMKTISTYTSM